MARGLVESVFKPRFQEALSGGFPTVSDPDKKVHTLARLALKTFEEGDLLGTGGFYRYEPLWAPNVRSVVGTETRGTRLDRLEEIDYLFLCGVDDYKASLMLMSKAILTDADPSERLDGLVVETSSGSSEIAIQTDSDIDRAKLDIAHSAQAFFDEIA
ncbi:MAG TPA: hypothetical protein VGF75_01130 [Candidatus Saccharimonadales bacterium]